MKELECNGLCTIVSQALEEMKAEQGENFSLAAVNLAELQRRTGISRSRLRRLKKNNFKVVQHGLTGKSTGRSVLNGFTSVINNLLSKGVSNSVICYERLKQIGYKGSKPTVRRYIAAHKDLIPAKRILVKPQGNRGRRYTTGPGETYQMDWGFTNVMTHYGKLLHIACFAMICHHCGQRYIEFFPDAKQEHLLIGMIHAFQYMGVPRYVLTDNMKSVVIKRNAEGLPVWQKDYESCMDNVGFQTKLCKPRHPFTKGKVERLVRFVKENFLLDRSFWNISDLNQSALAWCNLQNQTYHKEINGVPEDIHFSACVANIRSLPDTPELQYYLCPERRISFDGFISYEGYRFGVPFRYAGRIVRVCRTHDTICIYSPDMKILLTTHNVTWTRQDHFCKDQYVALQPEEFPTAPVHTTITMLSEPDTDLSFEKFNFDKEVEDDE